MATVGHQALLVEECKCLLVQNEGDTALVLAAAQLMEAGGKETM